MGRRRGRRTRSDGEGCRANAERAFPTFEHNQWTFEGEIERLGAFASGAARHSGPKRWMAVFLVLLILIPLAMTVVFSLARVLTR